MAKSFSWSFSKYKNYFTCPKRHYEVDLAKNYTDSSDQLIWGNEVHNSLAKAALGKDVLPAPMKDYQHWIDKIKWGPGQLYVEQKLAMTKDFQPCAWFANDAWVRVVIDAIRINGPVALAWDWKTGKVTHDSRQLMISTQVIFAHHPAVQRVKTEFIWLKDDCKTPETFDRATIMKEWPPVLDGVKQMEEAAKTLTYPPKPGKLCHSYCPVTSCPFFGKRHS